jgi:hypothetical protein
MNFKMRVHLKGGSSIDSSNADFTQKQLDDTSFLNSEWMTVVGVGGKRIVVKVSEIAMVELTENLSV